MSPADPAVMPACPLCGGRVKWAGFTSGRYREAWRRQVAEGT